MKTDDVETHVDALFSYLSTCGLKPHEAIFILDQASEQLCKRYDIEIERVYADKENSSLN